MGRKRRRDEDLQKVLVKTDVPELDDGRHRCRHHRVKSGVNQLEGAATIAAARYLALGTEGCNPGR